MADEDREAKLHWLGGGLEINWEAFKEDAEGSFQASLDEFIQRAKKRRLQQKQANIRLGMMRHLFVAVDLSQAMSDQDLRPTRQICTFRLLSKFIEEYFDQNPISQLGIIITKNKRAEKLTELGGNPKRHIAAVRKAEDLTCDGEPSLQNSLELAAQTLRHMPGHGSKEIIVIFGSLTTCDPGDISKTIQALKNYNIRCSVIGLAAEVRICKKLSQDTNGTYGVILDESHFKDLMMAHVTPPPFAVNAESSLIRMGFPQHLMQSKEEKPSMCLCHLDVKTHSDGFSSQGYHCPQCNSKYCELPVECKACGLTLVSAPHLARSYHHLFPLQNFQELLLTDIPEEMENTCYACQSTFKEQMVYQCGKCLRFFCLECNLFVHETLHTCPGCACQPPIQDYNHSGFHQNTIDS